MSNKKDERKKIPARPALDSLDLAIIGLIAHSPELRGTGEIIGKLREVSSCSDREWIDGSLSNNRLGYRRVSKLERQGYVISDCRGFLNSKKGKQLVSDLKTLGTVTADPLDPSFNLAQKFGLYHVPSLGHPALAFDGTLLGTTRPSFENSVEEAGSIQGRVWPKMVINAELGSIGRLKTKLCFQLFTTTG